MYTRTLHIYPPYFICSAYPMGPIVFLMLGSQQDHDSKATPLTALILAGNQELKRRWARWRQELWRKRKQIMGHRTIVTVLITCQGYPAGRRWNRKPRWSMGLAHQGRKKVLSEKLIPERQDSPVSQKRQRQSGTREGNKEQVLSPSRIISELRMSKW